MELVAETAIPISPEQMEKLKVSVDALRLRRIGPRFFGYLSSSFPEFQKWYSKDKMETAARYFGLLDLIVHSLDNVRGVGFKLHPELANSLHDLGVVHKDFGVTTMHYQIVFDQLIGVIRQEDRVVWSIEVESSWRCLFNYILYCIDPPVKPAKK